MKNRSVKKVKFVLSLSIASIIGIQVAQSSKIHCPALLNEKSRKSVIGIEEYYYSGDTTGDKRIFVETTHNEYGGQLEQPYKFIGASGGAAGSIVCKYQEAKPNSNSYRELYGISGSTHCQIIKPESGDITTENNYFECSE